MLQHLDPEKPILVATDASVYAVAAILMQPEYGQGGKVIWKPVAFHSRKLIPAEQRYDTHGQELLAIMECFCEWRHYLEGSRDPIKVQSDHNNLIILLLQRL